MQLLEILKNVKVRPNLRPRKPSKTKPKPHKPVKINPNAAAIKRRGPTYPIQYLLLFTILAMLSGCTTYSEIEVWMKAKFLVLRKHFQLHWVRMPSDSLIQDVFSRIDILSLEEILRAQGIALANIGKSKPQGCIDGKVLRGSYDKATDQSAIMLLTCFEPLSKMILGHLEIHDKLSEIPAAQNLLNQLDLDIFMTSDALHCQKKQPI
jgi:hypothetical protein